MSTTEVVRLGRQANKLLQRRKGSRWSVHFLPCLFVLFCFCFYFTLLEIKSRALHIGGKGFTTEQQLSPGVALFTVSSSLLPWMAQRAFLAPYALASKISCPSYISCIYVLLAYHLHKVFSFLLISVKYSLCEW